MLVAGMVLSATFLSSCKKEDSGNPGTGTILTSGSWKVAAASASTSTRGLPMH
jgi:hypothetical protein